MSVTIASPLAGWATPLSEVPDPVFAEKMLGDGIAIDPVEGRLVAPGAGVVVSVHPAGHAVTLQLDAGPLLLMHIGLETVGLAGVGFAPKATDGQRVAAGDPLIEFDLDVLARKAKSLITPIIVTNGDAFALETSVVESAVAAGDPVMTWRATGTTAVDAAADAPITTRALDLPLAHGLHARPAARIAKLAADYPGPIEIVAPSGKAVSARSAVAMLALALPHGAAITVRGSDPDGVAAVADLLASGMGELRAVAAAPEAATETVGELPTTLTGVVAVAGVAIGPAFRVIDPAAEVSEQGQGIDTERAVLVAAKHKVRTDLDREAAGKGDAAEIAGAHLALLDDPELAAAAAAAIGEGKSAGFAWRQAIGRFADQLRSAGNARFAERIDDLEDLGRRVVMAIHGGPEQAPPPPGAILVADDLYPSQLIALADAGLAGIATARGGATSHAAIIAAGLGIPMLVSLGAALGRVEPGVELAIERSMLSIAPDASAATTLRDRIATRQARRQAALATASHPAVTTDGVRIEVFVNLGSATDARRAVEEGAEGCGLLRTEFLFLDRATPPDEEEQRAAYQAIADALDGRPLIVRTLDIGADKPAPYLPQAAEENPALGLRGIRLQLARRDLLDTQLRALLRVKAPLKLMLPMVADRAELAETRRALAKHAADLGMAAPQLGIMVETPAAALTAASLAAEADFFSIGSNDLAQYTLARDRTNPAVAAGLDGLHPAVLRLIDETVRGGNAHKRWTGVCGELAADPQAAPLLIGLGVTELSVPGAAVAETKALVRTLNLAQCQALAARALIAADAHAVRALVSEQGQ
ncbi:phosphoenolpyruvate--protein phosphotransferase [Sphingomonas panacisoli]|uniref:phosphoenolpyruvate--protein phosphotransferase n=1 Tax=Sphingomonas panacisoli TaxID=1813879 RepID=A0A5B8LLE0_9SPHN|nr:phosphoenolpyruvate--protein phosphotransferase [Sphingomonas panacisoli]QDZ08759.1 phosphoenolpyruvate--protein phosphotransferase [Sphingomonas panacisoli]